MGVGLLGLLISWASGRREQAVAPDWPQEAVPTSPIGFRLSGEWRPDRTQREQLGVLLVLWSVVFLLFGSASHVTPQLADARAGSARIAPVAVERVLWSKSRPLKGGGTYYTSKLSLRVSHGDVGGGNAAGGGQLVKGTIETSDSVGYGDRFWALCNADKGADAQLAQTQDELEALRDGSVCPSLTLLGISAAAAVGGLALLLRRRFKLFDDSGSAVAEALRTGNAQALAVAVEGTPPEGKRALGVGLRLRGEDGEGYLYVNRFVDIEHLADTLSGRGAWLYWERARDREPLAGRPGRKGELLPAVLVVGSGAAARYVRGWMPRKPEWPVAQGRRLGPMNPESCPGVEQLGAGVLRPPRARFGALVWLSIAALATVSTMAFPIGGGSPNMAQVVIVLVVVCTVVGMRMTEAKWRPSARRQERRDAVSTG